MTWIFIGLPLITDGTRVTLSRGVVGLATRIPRDESLGSRLAPLVVLMSFRLEA
jgi:hypothetical protein